MLLGAEIDRNTDNYWPTYSYRPITDDLAPYKLPDIFENLKILSVFRRRLCSRYYTGREWTYYSQILPRILVSLCHFAPAKLTADRRMFATHTGFG